MSDDERDHPNFEELVAAALPTPAVRDAGGWVLRHAGGATLRTNSVLPHTDPGALVIGPTGVGVGPNGTLYVADSVGNRITAIPYALFRHGSDGTGKTVTSGGFLNGPLGLAIAPYEETFANEVEHFVTRCSGRGEELAAATDKQLRAEFGRQLMELHADRAWGQKHPFRRARNASGFNDGQEQLELADFHKPRLGLHRLSIYLR